MTRPRGFTLTELLVTMVVMALLGTALIGIPVSTTHTIAGAIMGVGSVRRLSAVRWGIAGNMVAAWILTIPCSGLMAAGTWWLVGGLRSFIHF